MKKIGICVFWILLSLPKIEATSEQQQHAPYKMIWKIQNGETWTTYNSTMSEGALWTWWPSLYLNLDKVYPLAPEQAGRMKTARISISDNGFYVCPGFRDEQMKDTCGLATSYYCASWACVTSNDGAWKWTTKPWFLKWEFVKRCHRPRGSKGFIQRTAIL